MLGFETVELSPQIVGKERLDKRGDCAALLYDGGMQNFAVENSLVNFSVNFFQRGIVGASPRVFRHSETNYFSRTLECVVNKSVFLCYTHAESYESGGHVQIFKGSAHAVLAAYCRSFQPELRVKRAKQRGQRLSPAVGRVAGFFEKLLQSKSDCQGIYAAGDQLGNGSHNGINGSRKGRFFHQIRIKRERRTGYRGGVARAYGGL